MPGKKPKVDSWYAATNQRLNIAGPWTLIQTESTWLVIWQMNQLISQNSVLLPLKSDIFTKFRIPKIYSFDQWESKGCFSVQMLIGQKNLKYF